MMMGLIANSTVRWIGICLLCLFIGYGKGCSTGYTNGKEVVQKEFSAYKDKIAEDIAKNNALVIENATNAYHAQAELRQMQQSNSNKLLVELADLKQRMNNVLKERITDPKCMLSSDELRVLQEAARKAGAGPR